MESALSWWMMRLLHTKMDKQNNTFFAPRMEKSILTSTRKFGIFDISRDCNKKN